MISTYCLNPCLDKAVELSSFTLKATNRILASRMDPGGKGVNVARVLSTFGMDVKCVCVLPEKGSEDFLDLLGDGAGELVTIATPGSIRTNTKVHDMAEGGITELNESGVPLSTRAVEALHDTMMSLKNVSELHVLSGSLPPKASPAMYYNMISELAPAPVFLDTSGTALLEGIKAKPVWVKPNLAELETIAGKELKSLEEVKNAARSVIERGVRYVCVSLGENGAMLVQEDCAYYAPGVPVQIQSTVGAGDAMVAGLILGYVKTGDAKEALRCGMAAATASCTTSGTQMLTREVYDIYYPQVEIRSV